MSGGLDISGIDIVAPALPWDDADELPAPQPAPSLQLVEAAPARFASKFGAIPWSDLDKPRAPYEWLVRGVLPARERAIVYGEPQSGKSFWALDLAMSVARGETFFGCRTKQAGVIYCAFEGGKGFANRVNAYRIGHSLGGEQAPFVILTKDADLFGSKDTVAAPIAEIRHWASTFDVDLGLIVFDTVSACTPGMDENSGTDMGRFLAHGRSIAGDLGAALLFIHHLPKHGGTTPRGSGKLTGDLETAIHVMVDPHGAIDENQRPVRIAKITKQREFKQGATFPFVLRSVEIGVDGDGDPVNSCFIAPPGGTATVGAASGFKLSPVEEEGWKALWDALKEHGEAPPASLNLPAGTRAIHWKTWKQSWERLDPNPDEDERARAERIKKRMQRAGAALLKWGLIGRSNPWVWWSGKPVRGYRDTFPKKTKKTADITSEPPSSFDDDPISLL